MPIPRLNPKLSVKTNNTIEIHIDIYNKQIEHGIKANQAFVYILEIGTVDYPWANGCCPRGDKISRTTVFL